MAVMISISIPTPTISGRQANSLVAAAVNQVIGEDDKITRNMRRKKPARPHERRSIRKTGYKGQ